MTVLAYHKVGTPELGGTWCTRRQFASHLAALESHGCRVVDLETYATLLHANGGGLPAAVLISFDDAFESFAHHAWPQLKARQWPAVLFVLTGFVGKRATWDLPLPGRRARHLDWPQLRRLAEDGVIIGSHGCRHRDLRYLNDDELRFELAHSREELQQRLGQEIRAVSYPFGRCTPRVRAAAAESGYTLGFTMAPQGPVESVLAQPRWGVYITDSPAALLDKIDASRFGHRIQSLFTRGVSGVAEIAAHWTRIKTTDT